MIKARNDDCMKGTQKSFSEKKYGTGSKLTPKSMSWMKVIPHDMEIDSQGSQ